jgi:hypothetical protein
LIIGTKTYFTVPSNKNGKHGAPGSSKKMMKSNQEEAEANRKAKILHI